VIRLWYDQNGAQIGKPWKVQLAPQAEAFLAERVAFQGYVHTEYRRDEAPHGLVVCSPDAVWVWVDGKTVNDPNEFRVADPQARVRDCLDAMESGPATGSSDMATAVANKVVLGED
jgi:hypothetical protein